MTHQSPEEELREQIKHLLGYCEVDGHENCTYESSRNPSQELDAIMHLITTRDEQREREIRIDEIKRYCWVSVIQAARQLGMQEPMTWEAAFLQGLTPMMADARIKALTSPNTKEDG